MRDEMSTPSKNTNDVPLLDTVLAGNNTHISLPQGYHHSQDEARYDAVHPHAEMILATMMQRDREKGKHGDWDEHRR